jgi:hypothetical protein
LRKRVSGEFNSGYVCPKDAVVTTSMIMTTSSKKIHRFKKPTANLEVLFLAELLSLLKRTL